MASILSWPQWVKAIDIVHATDDLPDCMVVRLGGLHMAFSYMGSEGQEYTVSGSGQEEMWSTAYAEGSIPQMINGHSYSSVLCVHILVLKP